MQNRHFNFLEVLYDSVFAFLFVEMACGKRSQKV